MSKNQKIRKLAAVMFVDMVGYTRLMQTDEQQAIINRDRHREVLRQEAKQYQGEILQYFGDGSLILFPSSIQAVKAGVNIQKAMVHPHEIPLRIGIHMGDVAYDDEGLYGDSVNIAARIESMAAPFSVVVSDRVREQIKNQKDLPTQSLGKFQLKNVKRPVELFAMTNQGLVVPSPNDMQGKGEAIIAKNSNWKKHSLLLGLLVFLLGVFYFMFPNDSNFFEEIKDDRVAVLIFKNNTGNTDLDYIGEMTSEWLTRALMETKKAKVVNTNSVKQNMQLASLIPMDDETKKGTFSKVTGAKYIIQGAYYQEGDELIFSSQVNDATTGTVHFSFEEFRGTLQKPSAIIKEMKNKIAGFWLTQGEVMQSRFSPPNKDAWLEYQKGREAWAGDRDKTFKENVAISLQHFQKAVELDSTFMLPWIQIGMCHANLDTSCANEKWKEHQKKLDRKKHLMTEYEWNVHQIDKQRFSKNFRKANEYAKKNYDLDPLSLRDNFLYGNTAFNFGDAVTTLEAHSKIPFDLIPNSTDRKNLIMNLSHAQLHLGQLEEAAKTIQYGTYPWQEAGLKIKVAIQKNDAEEISKLIKQYSNNIKFIDAGWYAENLGKADLAKMIYTKGKELATDDFNKAFFAFHLGKFKESEKVLETALSKTNLEEVSSIVILYLFLNYQKSGKQSKANFYLQHLEKLSQIECKRLMRTDRYYYLTALAALGKTNKMEEQLRESTDVSLYYVDHPILFKAMKANPLFRKSRKLDK